MVDVGQLLENQKLGGFLLTLIGLSWLVTCLDGMDSNFISFAAPYFSIEYHLTHPQTAWVFSAHQLGTLLGGLLWVYFGDLVGRRPTIVLSTFSFGLLTAAFRFANGYGSLVALRFLDGIPLGGMLPLLWALNIEYVPKRYRATIVTLIMVGYPAGISLSGPLSILLTPRWGWKAGLVVGGLAAVAGAVILLWKLPESVRFLVSKGREPESIARLLTRLIPDTKIPQHAGFIMSDEQEAQSRFRPSLLFQGYFLTITPLIWIAYIASSFAMFFMLNWTPTIFEALGYTRAESAMTATWMTVMGVFAALLLMRFTDTKGAIAITVMPAMGALLLLVVGTVNVGANTFVLLVILIGFFLGGGHFGMHSISGIFYPSGFRANGAGWATSIAKVGSITGPLVAGWLLSTTLPIKNLYAFLALCPLVFFVSIFGVGKLHRRFGPMSSFSSIPTVMSNPQRHSEQFLSKFRR